MLSSAQLRSCQESCCSPTWCRTAWPPTARPACRYGLAHMSKSALGRARQAERSHDAQARWTGVRRMPDRAFGARDRFVTALEVGARTVLVRSVRSVGLAGLGAASVVLASRHDDWTAARANQRLRDRAEQKSLQA